MNPDGPEPEDLHSKTVNHPFKYGDVFSMRTQGGGGFGTPEERDPAAIERDLREGKISANSAWDSYGLKGS